MTLDVQGRSWGVGGAAPAAVEARSMCAAATPAPRKSTPRLTTDLVHIEAGRDTGVLVHAQPVRLLPRLLGNGLLHVLGRQAALAQLRVCREEGGGDEKTLEGSYSSSACVLFLPLPSTQPTPHWLCACCSLLNDGCWCVLEPHSRRVSATSARESAEALNLCQPVCVHPLPSHCTQLQHRHSRVPPGTTPPKHCWRWSPCATADRTSERAHSWCALLLFSIRLNYKN